MKKALIILFPMFALFLIVIGVVTFYIQESLAPIDNKAATVTLDELREAGLYSVMDNRYDAQNKCNADGESDCTDAIQAAMDDAYKNDGVAFFPPGRYKITRTLKALQDRQRSRRDAYQLVGSTGSNQVPVIVLGAGTFNDNNAGNDSVFEEGKKKAMIHFWTCDFVKDEDDDNQSTCIPPYEEQLNNVNSTIGNSAMQMASGIRNIKFEIATNNPDAMGVRFSGAQNNVLSNVHIEMTSGFAGIYGNPGIDSVNENISIKGGKYGIYQGYGLFASYTNVRLENQTILAITSPWGESPTVFSGFHIKKQTAPAVGDVEGWDFNESFNPDPADTKIFNSYMRGSFSLSDGVIEFEQNDPQKAAVDTFSGRTFTINNVFVKNAGKLIRREENGNVFVDTPGNASGWSEIVLVANTIKENTGIIGANKEAGWKVIDGEKTRGDYFLDQNIKVSGVNAPNIAAMLNRHSLPSGRLPSPDQLLQRSKDPNSGVINVADEGVIPLASVTDNSPDYAGKINELINRPGVEYLFFPKGRYPIKDTIILNSSTKLIGLSNVETIIATHPQWNPTGDVIRDTIGTQNDVNAKTTLAHIQIEYDVSKTNNKFNGVHWQAGRNSVIYNVMLRGRGAASQNCDGWGGKWYDYYFNNSGGGRVWGMSSGGAGCAKYSGLYRGLMVDGTTQPLTIYGFNPEDGHGEQGTNPTQATMGEIKNSTNVSIRGHKSEDAKSLNVNGSSNVILIGGGGTVDWTFMNNTNMVALNIVPKRIKWPNADKEFVVVRDLLTIKSPNGSVRDLSNTRETLSIVRDGNFNINVFTYEEVIGTPTITQTPSITPTHSTTPTPGNSVTPTPRPGHSGTPTPTPRRTSTPTPTVINSRPPITTTTYYTSECGRADSDRDGDFDISDFVTFAASYQDGTRECDDINEDYGSCGGRDVDRDGKLNIADFGGTNGFASRYFPKTSCALP